MNAVDPQVDPALLPAGCKPFIIAENQPQYLNLPSIVTPNHVVITRWTFTDEERKAIAEGQDIFLTIWGTPIRPIHLNVGPANWTEV